MSKWEPVKTQGIPIGLDLYRLPVPGGWLYAIIGRDGGEPSMAFVPDRGASLGTGLTPNTWPRR